MIFLENHQFDGMLLGVDDGLIHVEPTRTGHRIIYHRNSTTVKEKARAFGILKTFEVRELIRTLLFSENFIQDMTLEGETITEWSRQHLLRGLKKLPFCLSARSGIHMISCREMPACVRIKPLTSGAMLFVNDPGHPLLYPLYSKVIGRGILDELQDHWDGDLAPARNLIDRLEALPETSDGSSKALGGEAAKALVPLSLSMMRDEEQASTVH